MKRIALDGFELAYERRGEGAPLVLIHGFPLDHSIWEDVLPLLEKDFDLILPDLRGFGESTIPDSPNSMTAMSRDIASLLDALGIEKASLAGHSMGGYVSLALAREFPHRLSGLALVSSQAVGDTLERKEGRYKTAADVAEQGVRVVVEAMGDKFSPKPQVCDALRPLMERQSIPGVAGALKAMAEREDMTNFLASFSLPLVLIHGDTDALIPVDRAREIHSLVPSAHFVELSGAGHTPMMEAPEKTAAALKTLK
jgi:pimeloyl-ACP methyl ester carboxylesterase